MKGLRRELHGDAYALADNFFSLPECQKGKSFFVYNSLPDEADTLLLIERLLAAGKTVYLPRVEGNTMSAVPYCRETHMRAGAYGIQEPVGQAYTGEIDVCVLPLLACDLTGVRLGYGGGYYDRFLQNRKIFKAGYGYDYQVVKALPAEQTDVPLDAIITDKRTVRIGEAKS